MNSKLTEKEIHFITTGIWNLMNKMKEQSDKLEDIHNLPFPNENDGARALHIIFNLWNSEEYSELESFLMSINNRSE